MNKQFKVILLITLSILASCSDGEKSDAFGNFEATTTTISAKGTGQLMQFKVKEGNRLQAGVIIGYIDTVALHLERLQLQAQLAALDEKLKDAEPEIEVQEERLANLIRERDRTKALLSSKAATQKQLDDYNGGIEIINRQINSLNRSTEITNRGILAESKPIKAQIDVLENRIKDHQIINPIAGSVLSKLVEPNEFVRQGTPLYKIADLSEMRLRAYTSAKLLQKVALNDEVKVLVDTDEENYREIKGVLVWISEEAEFTPKTIQTKEERVGLVYAIDILVKNDGHLKIGMPAEVVFTKKDTK